MTHAPVLLWVRRELRLADHPALVTAAASKRPVIPVFVLDDEAPARWAMGAASRWWLGNSLGRFAQALDGLGSRLIIRRGRTEDVLAQLAGETGAASVYMTRAYEPWARRLETRLKSKLQGAGIELKRFAGGLLFEPEMIATQQGGSFRVYSPFARACFAAPPPRTPLAPPSSLMTPDAWPKSLSIDSLMLLPTKPDWAGGMRNAWMPGEDGAIRRLEEFLAGPVGRYHEHRDRPDLPATSRLSPHLHFGEISAATCWHVADGAARSGSAGQKGVEKFLREVLWREFSYHLLYHHEDLPEQPFRPEFEAFPWRDDASGLEAWQKGQTGYPIVDAGMRELWATGWMHNRVRMVVASFLIKDLLVPWQQGEAWFWDTLVDADLANNAASWQWVAGSGADAAPYFRVFNPTTQGTKFDPDGAYVRKWVPELARLPADLIHKPHEAPAAALREAGVTLGKDYPQPIVDHKAARERALAAFAALKPS